MKVALHHGDCLDVLRTLPDNSVDSVVTDPPYGLAFMNKKWDYDVPSHEIWAECLRVLKPGGHLLAFARMDNAQLASVATVLTKAAAAATMRQATGPVRRGEAEPDLLLNLSLQNAAAAAGGKMTGLLGGVPVVVDGQVIGAVGLGVGGGTGEQDAEIAKAGIERLLKELR